MAPGQTPELPAHPFTGTDVEMAAENGDVLTNVENDQSQAALRQLAIQATVRIVQPAPMDFPPGRVEDLDGNRISSRNLIKEARLAASFRHDDPFGSCAGRRLVHLVADGDAVSSLQ